MSRAAAATARRFCLRWNATSPKVSPSSPLCSSTAALVSMLDVRRSLTALGRLEGSGRSLGWLSRCCCCCCCDCCCCVCLCCSRRRADSAAEGDEPPTGGGWVPLLLPTGREIGHAPPPPPLPPTPHRLAAGSSGTVWPCDSSTRPRPCHCCCRWDGGVSWASGGRDGDRCADTARRGGDEEGTGSGHCVALFHDADACFISVQPNTAHPGIPHGSASCVCCRDCVWDCV